MTRKEWASHGFQESAGQPVTSEFWTHNKYFFVISLSHIDLYKKNVFVGVLCFYMLNLATVIRWTFLSRGKTPGRGQAVSGEGREQRGMGVGAAPGIRLPPSQLRADLV